MSFSENMAKVVADQLARFVTLNRHQLAGQVANLDFWVDQARHALDVIDGYEPRFRRLKAEQDRYVAEHKTLKEEKGTFYFFGKSRMSPFPALALALGDLRQLRRVLGHAAELMRVACRMEHSAGSPNAHDRILGFGSVP